MAQALPQVKPAGLGLAVGEEGEQGQSSQGYSNPNDHERGAPPGVVAQDRCQGCAYHTGEARLHGYSGY